MRPREIHQALVRRAASGTLARSSGSPEHEVLWRVLRSGSKSFAAAAWCLPRETRRAAAMVYAYCRAADDAVDNVRGAGDPLEGLWAQLDRIYAGQPLPDPIERGFCEAVHRYGIPRFVPNALLEGFLWDLRGRRYETLERLEAYCVRVASSVGVMMCRIMDVRDPRVLGYACDLGIAMQLTNIARDVGDDARNGRIYLPLAWLREEGIDADALIATPVFSDALGRVVKRLLDAARRRYSRADVGVSHLPRNTRVAIRAASLIYADIGRAIAQDGFDSVSQRSYTTRSRKLCLLVRALASVLWWPRPLHDEPTAGAAFLIDSEHDAAPA